MPEAPRAVPGNAVGVQVRVPKAGELIANHLRRQIVRGQLREGDALPPENDLMQQFKVSRPTLREAFRVLKPGKVLALYVSDSYVHPENFYPIGFDLFARMMKIGFKPIDIVAVTRHNKTLEMGNYRKAAEEGNFFLRGFNYLFITGKA